MDGFSYQIHENDFGNGDVDRVLFDGQNGILDIEPINGCQGTGSFLNPINDILGDINEFTKNFGCDQGTAFQMPESTGAASVECYNSLSNVSKSVEDAGLDSGYFNITSDSDGTNILRESNTEYSAQDCNYLSGDHHPSTLNHWFQNVDQQHIPYATTCLQTMPLISHLNKQVQPQEYSDMLLNTIGSLPASTTITPITLSNHQSIQRSVSPEREDVTIEARYIPERYNSFNTNTRSFQRLPMISNDVYNKNKIGSKNIAKHRLPQNDEQLKWHQNNFNDAQETKLPSQDCTSQAKSFGNVSQNPFISFPTTHFQQSSGPVVSNFPTIDYQKNCLHWTAVFPHKHFIQPPEMIIMHPLRTRKVISARRTIAPTCESSCSTTINLSEYFDTSSIDIPIIKERSRAENRRKQKHHIIPGSENLLFEVQNTEFNGNEIMNIPPGVADEHNISTDIDPYPETELPELDEIFRRKKKIPALPTLKKSCTTAQLVTTGPLQKKQCQVHVLQQPQQQQGQIIQETSTSFEEKIYLPISIRKGRSNISVDRNDSLLSSESDSFESDADEKVNTQNSKSFKCKKCRKIFKTTRSLAIHVKRCSAICHELSPISSNKNFSEADDVKYKNIKNIKLSDRSIEKKLLPKLSQATHENYIDISLEYNKNHNENSLERKYDEDMKINNVPTEEKKIRPITRSQTRRSTGRSIKLTNLKRSTQI